MGLFRKRDPERRSRMKPFDRKALSTPEPILESDAIEEGILMAEYSARMALKNRILVAVLGEGDDFEEVDFVDDARDVLTTIAEQMTAGADLAVDERREAAEKAGRGDSMHDYHEADVENLELREATSRAVAAELVRRSRDAETLPAFISQAREDAWHDVAAEISAKLDLQRPASALDSRYRRTREQRMRMVKNVDLSRLEQERLNY
ncbi:asparagine synthase [Glaciibacter flavus]|uniref:Asparagine synthase n=1 Tax=Orlajensenia flava TaxID=2565934 RepID=A0A4S4FV73_9MICO|nr:asparagine synthase [Glaciibacter flavus]THG34251.1 asparagine synthase [Glaciibacter flavus]